MNLRIFDSTQDLVQAAARTIVQRVAGTERGAIGLSGGSTPRPLYELLGSSPHREALANRAIVWVIVDERYVPIDDPQSNSAMIQRTLFREGRSALHKFLTFRTELNDPARTAAEFERAWKSMIDDALDIVILGVGDDGHTASLFPGTPVMEVSDRIAAEAFVPRLKQWRVTLTLPVIRAAKLRIVLAAGESKARILREVREGADYPIARATAGDIETWWFVDRAAAAETGNQRKTSNE